jgi:hypothetical protein
MAERLLRKTENGGTLSDGGFCPVTSMLSYNQTMKRPHGSAEA